MVIRTASFIEGVQPWNKLIHYLYFINDVIYDVQMFRLTFLIWLWFSDTIAVISYTATLSSSFLFSWKLPQQLQPAAHFWKIEYG